MQKSSGENKGKSKEKSGEISATLYLGRNKDLRKTGDSEEVLGFAQLNFIKKFSELNEKLNG